MDKEIRAGFIRFSCEICGKESDYLTSIESQDRSVGYKEIKEVCDECLESMTPVRRYGI